MLLRVTTIVISSSSSGNNAAPGQTIVVSASSSGDAQELSFGFVDTNGDGIIDEEEFKAFLDARKGQTTQYGVLRWRELCSILGVPLVQPLRLPSYARWLWERSPEEGAMLPSRIELCSILSVACSRQRRGFA
jgi:hypothetical protein